MDYTGELFVIFKMQKRNSIIKKGITQCKYK